jgi:hypothetical protein
VPLAEQPRERVLHGLLGLDAVTGHGADHADEPCVGDLVQVADGTGRVLAGAAHIT